MASAWDGRWAARHRRGAVPGPFLFDPARSAGGGQTVRARVRPVASPLGRRIICPVSESGARKPPAAPGGDRVPGPARPSRRPGLRLRPAIRFSIILPPCRRTAPRRPIGPPDEALSSGAAAAYCVSAILAAAWVTGGGAEQAPAERPGGMAPGCSGNAILSHSQGRSSTSNSFILPRIPISIKTSGPILFIFVNKCETLFRRCTIYCYFQNRMN